MNENSVIHKIASSEVVIQHFGYWPTFHDTEIRKVVFEANPGFYPSVTFLLKAFATLNEKDERGYYRKVKQCEIELQFTGIKEIEFEGFGHQNVILSLEFGKQEGDLTCTLDASTGLAAYIVAQAAKVVSLNPIT
ncbi:hypothetical protein H8B15_18305 [Hymenobacter sp. BT507]|uniref:Immunity protein 50 n=1 Tax=Hymenobacter citatus TaxID=2763506 RepID=A0ABR7MP72_9BACT|nr:Imm50 family immunity protein [Hymenobacter citatus]MBC6612881.1 hypothetical protein [Hymenobacter citatus]